MGGGTHERSEDDSEKVQEHGSARKTPEEKCTWRAAECTDSHDGWTRETIAEVTQKNLAHNRREVEKGEYNGGGQLVRHALRECGDIEGDGEV